MKQWKFKRLIAFLLAASILAGMILAAVPVALAADESNTLQIETPADLVELAKNCTMDTWSQGKRVILKADISLADVEFETIPTFGGVFYGNGHTISGLKITEYTAPAGLFAVLQESGVIRNLKVSGSVTPSGDGSNVGGIVGENYGTIMDCDFTSSVSGETNVGGIVGINALTGKIKGCSASGAVVGDQMTGGIVGCNLGVVDNCKNNAYVNTVSTDAAISPEDIDLDFSLDLSTLSSMDTSMAASDTGGIAGYSSGIVSDCTNSGSVGYPHTGYNIGGIVGRSCGYLHGCENGGEVYGRKDVGGIAGQMEPYIAQNITESTLAKLERQLDELDALLTTAIDDADYGAGIMSSRLNSIADYTDSAASAARNIRTYGSVTTTVTASGEGSASGSATVDPPDVEVDGSVDTGGGAGGVGTPIGGIAVGGGGSDMEISGGATEGSAGVEAGGTVSGNANAYTQISVTTSLGGLSSAISGMAGQMRLMSGELSGTSGTLSGDVRAIQAKINEISDTSMELFRADSEGSVLIDSSEVDIELVTLGKASDCTNAGSIQGDINVGGVTGAMAMEYELDPEDDISSNLDGEMRRQYEIKSIIQSCVNTGSTTAKRSYAGGICGRMDLGLIALAENYGQVTSESGNYVGGIAGLTSSTIRHCFAKCTLSGGKYIGGIVGSGVAEDLSGNASTVAGCYSMVDIASYQEFAGAISGDNAGSFLENRFISDVLAGINGRSYAGKAEPISYAELSSIASGTTVEESAAEGTDGTEETEAEETDWAATSETSEETEGQEVPEVSQTDSVLEALRTESISTPDAFLQLNLTFVADDVVLKTVPFEYGASFDATVYPEIPAKDGYYASWDRTELNDLHFDTVVTAVYTSYVSALSNGEIRNDGRTVFFVEGQFDNEAEPEITPLPNTPKDFDFLSDDWTDFLVNSFSGATVSREIVEQWKVTIPEDGEERHRLRYLAPDGSPENLDIYVKQSDGWKKADTEIIGSYLVFSVEGTEAEIAAISTMNVWWVWLIAGIIFLLLLLTILGLIQKILRKRKAAKSARAERESALFAETENPDLEAAPAAPAPNKKKRWLMPLLIILAFLLGIGSTAAYFILPDMLAGKEAYELLKAYADQDCLTMELSVNGTLDSQDISFDADIRRTTLEGKRIHMISQGSQTIYFCDGVAFLENGSAYRVGEAYPDYSGLIEQALDLYQYVEIDAKDGVYTLSAEGENAHAMLELLIPSVGDLLSDTNTVKVELVAEDDTASELRISGSGTLRDSGNTSFTVEAVMKLASETQEGIEIPAEVRNAVISGEYEVAERVTDDLLRLANGWQTLNEKDPLGADLTLHANCGPIVLEDSLEYYRWKQDGTEIGSIQKNGYALYFTDTTVCNKDGDVALSGETQTVEATKLLDIAYETCLNGSFDVEQNGEAFLYTLSLDEEGMRAVAYAIAPETEGMDIIFDSGSIQVMVSEETIQTVTFSLSGSVQVVLASAEVSMDAQIDFAEEAADITIPEAVKAVLEK